MITSLYVLWHPASSIAFTSRSGEIESILTSVVTGLWAAASKM